MKIKVAFMGEDDYGAKLFQVTTDGAVLGSFWCHTKSEYAAKVLEFLVPEPANSPWSEPVRPESDIKPRWR